ncbi:alpha-mannosidase [Amylocystis lapponica]|nr:alpha-mannosidase [Amylocystis lapponica]
MKWPTYWPTVVLSLLVIGLEAAKWDSRHTESLQEGWTTARKLAAREKTRALWYHGFDNYMQHAFPMDELAPLSCKGRGPDWRNAANIATNDVAGNFSVTLVDVLDTFVVLDDRPGFESAVQNVINHVSFDVDTKPQVFETTIRVLGGLLSGHIFANQTGQPFHLPWYRGELLSMALDLGERLLPAFSTPTGIPLARLNLRRGILRGETIETCTAGAGSLILEFGTLSRLTGDTRFEKAAHKAFFALWNRKSDIGLVGNTINAFTGAWREPETTGIGAGIDSFYEYALKWYVLSGEVEFLDVWQEAYASIMQYARAPDGFSYRSVNMHTGDVAWTTFDSLSAFWPGLQVLSGDVENAVKSHLIYWNVWRVSSGLPEVWDLTFRKGTSMQYPLRPEFVESTWYLYRATRDPFYLDVGERVLSDITSRARVDCGLAGIKDLHRNTQEDRMESFVLSETLKYLYLLFDEENALHADDSNYVLTTEGHILSLSQDQLQPISAVRRKLRGAEHVQCPAYQAPILAYDNWDADTGITGGIRSRTDMDQVRELIGLEPTSSDIKSWSPGGWCAVPQLTLYAYDFILSVNGLVVSEDDHPTAAKLVSVSDGYVLQNVTGIRAHIVSRLDGKGYDVTKLGPYAVRTGQLVYVNDTDLILPPVHDSKSVEKARDRRPRIPEVELRFHIDAVDPLFHLQQLGMHDTPSEAVFVASTALFGGDPTVPMADGRPLRFGHGNGVRLVRATDNPHGCLPYAQQFEDEAILVVRGECTFLEKLVLAQAAGASGVVVLSNEDGHINPSADAADIAAAGDTINAAAVVVLRQSAGIVVGAMLAAVEEAGLGQVILTVGSGDQRAVDSARESSKDTNRVLYLNGHPLLNTRLLV